MSLTRLSLAVVALLAASACGGATDVGKASSAGASSPSAPRSESKGNSPSPRSPESPGNDQTKKQATDDRFPEGYPKVVAVSSLPFELRHSYNVRTSRAVALAPGVWTPLLAGMTKVDAATAGFADGRCGAVRRYERQYLGGRRLHGDCW